MKVGLLIIASEVLDGKTIDANTKGLAEFLKTIHLETHSSITVRDNTDNIKTALKALLEICDVVVTSGGIGPTKDDLTKSTIAEFLGRKMVYSASAHEVAEQNYARLRRPFPGKDHEYCQLPQGFVPLNNSTGFAPPFFTEHLGKFILSGAGVPREFKSLLEDHFVSLLGHCLKKNHFIDSITLRTKKIPEEKIFKEVDSELWDKLATFGSVSSLPTLMGVDIGVNFEAATEVELIEKRGKILSIFKSSPVWEIGWQVGLRSLEEIIVETAITKNLSFGFAESCTGGLCSHRITSVSGSSQCFMGSVISYSNQVKENMISVNPKTIEAHSPVSLEVAKEMAQGAAQKLGVDIAISITGLAGPNGGSEGIPVGTFFVGIHSKNKTQAYQLQYTGNRELLKNRFAQTALFSLLETLKEFQNLEVGQ